jgi:hypothetical protein
MISSSTNTTRLRCFFEVLFINDYNSIIEQCQKLYDNTHATNQFIHARSLSTMKRAQRELMKTQAEYELFKKYKTRTAISK